jgi:hypothetical protein
MAKKTKSNVNLDTSKVLGFHTGAEVIFSRRYFVNHGIKFIDFGTGVVKDKIISKTSTPKLLVTFPFHRAFHEQPFSQMLSKSEVNNYKIVTMLEVYPAYLEKA